MKHVCKAMEDDGYEYIKEHAQFVYSIVWKLDAWRMVFYAESMPWGTIEIAYCPFCGKKLEPILPNTLHCFCGAPPHGPLTVQGDAYQMRCDLCGLHSEFGHDEAEAIKNWNDLIKTLSA
jgi:hypothetical protein